MVTVIHPSESLHRALNYNHQKEVHGKATCILAVNYPKDPEELNFYQKLHRLTNLAALRPRTKVNSVHISINFDPSENLDRPTLEAVAQSYMEKLGFGDQPYLVYEHRDAGHPHLHVVTTNITAKGERIGLHNIGKIPSEKARKAVEQEFHLVRADDKKQLVVNRVKAVAIKKVLYGLSETKQAIQNVLDTVLDRYKFTSLEELNAVLRQGNVQATRGSQQSRTYQRGGLLYQALDEDGKPKGVPIKASAFCNNLILRELTKRFEANVAERQGREKRIKLAIDWYFLKAKRPSMAGLKDALRQESITITEYIAKNGLPFGFTYVDHKTGAVFKGSDIAKEYTAKGIDHRISKEVVRIAKEPNPAQEHPGHGHSLHRKDTALGPEPRASAPPSSHAPPPTGHSQEDQPERSAGVPYELLHEQKKKRKKRNRL